MSAPGVTVGCRVGSGWVAVSSPTTASDDADAYGLCCTLILMGYAGAVLLLEYILRASDVVVAYMGRMLVGSRG